MRGGCARCWVRRCKNRRLAEVRAGAHGCTYGAQNSPLRYRILARRPYRRRNTATFPTCCRPHRWPSRRSCNRYRRRRRSDSQVERHGAAANRRNQRRRIRAERCIGIDARQSLGTVNAESIGEHRTAHVQQCRASDGKTKSQGWQGVLRSPGSQERARIRHSSRCRSGKARKRFLEPDGSRRKRGPPTPTQEGSAPINRISRVRRRRSPRPFAHRTSGEAHQEPAEDGSRAVESAAEEQVVREQFRG